jgi:hypothetical protein
MLSWQPSNTPEATKAVGRVPNHSGGTGSSSKKRRGSGWTRRKSRLALLDASGPGPGRPRKLAHSDSKSKLSAGLPIAARTPFDILCDKLNSNEWSKHLLEEALHYKHTGVLDHARALFDVAPLSTWVSQCHAWLPLTGWIETDPVPTQARQAPP